MNFPSDQIDPADKGKEWCLQYLKAIESDAVNNGGYDERKREFEKRRRLARGKQDWTEYLPVLDVTEEDLRNRESWKKIDWAPLKIPMKFVRVLVNELVSRHTDLIVDLIDDEGIQEKKMMEAKVNTYMLHEKMFNDLQDVSGVQVSPPLPPGVPKPQTPDETKDILSMYAPNPYAVEMKDRIEKTYRLNNWSELSREIAQDLVEVGLAGTRTVLGGNKHAPKVMPIIPEHMLLPYSRHNDYRDAWYIGQILKVTISDLRRMDHKKELTERDYFEIAQNQDKEAYSSLTYQDALNHFSEHSYYPYDDCKIDVVFAEWDSTDVNVFLTRKNRNGNITVKRKPYKWYDHEKDKDKFKKAFIDREVTLDSWDNIYTGMWIKGTDHVINWGLQESIENHGEDFDKPRKSFKLYTTGGSSFIDEIAPHIDNIMVNWYQMQHHQTQSRPDGLAVEIDSLVKAQHVGKGGEGGITWKDNLKMYQSIGTIVFKWIETSGGSTPFPIQQLPGGIPKAASEHFKAVLDQIQMISETSGLTATRVAGSVDPDIGKKVTELQNESSQSAFSHLTRAYDKIYEETSQRICHLIAEITRSSRFALAKKNMKAIKEFGQRIFEVSIDPGLSNYQRELLAKHVDVSLQNQMLLPEEAMIISKQKNLDRGIHLLLRFRREREEKAARQAQQQSEMQMRQNKEAQQSALQEKLQMLQVEAEAKKQLEMVKAQSEAEKLRIEKEYEMEVVRMKQEHEYRMKQLDQKFEAAMSQDEHDDAMELAEYNAAVQSRLAAKNKQEKPKTEKA